MDIFLIRKYNYTVNNSVENIRANILEITNRKWHDFSNNISGFLKDDNTFKFTHKWEIGFAGGSGSTIYLNGKIREENENVYIDITIRPNIILLFFFYLMITLSLCGLFGIKTMLEGPGFIIAPLLLLFCLIIFGIIYYMGNGLKNRFERLLYLSPPNDISTD